MATIHVDPALSAYEALAPFYDAYTADYGHERWLRNIEGHAQALGLTGNRLLDVACGTGRSFQPLLARGYDVTACDISPAMVARAREGARGRADVYVADMRALPDLGEFDLVTCLDDALNYLLSGDDLLAALCGFERSLRRGGVVVFDVNTLGTYRGFFARDAAADAPGTFFCWRGESDPDAQPGVIASSMIEVFSVTTAAAGESWRRTRSRHVQRHHPPDEVRVLLSEAGLELLDVRGQVTGAKLDPDPSEEHHVKLVYFARRPLRR